MDGLSIAIINVEYVQLSLIIISDNKGLLASINVQHISNIESDITMVLCMVIFLFVYFFF